MIIPLDSQGVNQYIADLEAVLSKTRLNGIVSFYAENRNILGFILNNLENLTPTYYLTKPMNIALTASSIDIKKLFSLVDREGELSYNKLTQFIRTYLKEIETIVRQEYSNDINYLLDLSLIYSNIFSLSRRKTFDTLSDRYFNLLEQLDNQKHVIPKMIRDVRLVLISKLVFYT